MMRILLIALVAIHGLIHLLGFVKAFRLADLPGLAGNVSKPAGLLWLLAAVCFVAAAVLLLLGSGRWWMPAAPALIISQVLIILSWNDAKFGTPANVIILFPLIVAFMESLPSSFSNVYRAEVLQGLSRSPRMTLVTEEDLRPLPAPVRAYLRHVGAVGKPRLQNFRAEFTGEFRRSLNSGWMDFRAEQENFFDVPRRAFFIHSTLYGVPFEGLHIYNDGGARMQIRVASLVSVVDARGPEMNRGETVTLLNDMCVLAPASLIDRSIRWEEVDSLTARATYTNLGNTVSALLRFNEQGELINFISGDRYLSADGTSYENYEWSTPLKDYRDFDGRKVAGEAEAVWQLPRGEYVYGRFRVKRVAYNCGPRESLPPQDLSQE